MGPSLWANLSVDVSKLESLDEPQYLVHWSSNRNIIDHGTANYSIAINDEQCPRGERGREGEMQDNTWLVLSSTKNIIGTQEISTP